MALGDTVQIPTSLAPIAMVRKLRLVPSAAAAESLADFTFVTPQVVASLFAMAKRSAQGTLGGRYLPLE
jgi:hypothetical protein